MKFKFFDDLESGQPPKIVKLPVAATQTLAIGDAVYLSSGQVTKRGVACGNVVGVMAQASASADEDTMVDVYLVTPYQRWRATADADASSAVLDSDTHDLTAAQLVAVSDTTGGSLFIWKTMDSTTDVIISFTKDYRA